jgi:RHS repeat-associated protein
LFFGLGENLVSKIIDERKSDRNSSRGLTEQTPQGIVSYGYNLAGQKTSMTVQGRPSVNYGYDSAGRLNSITQGSETFGYSYDILSRTTQMSRPNGITTNYSYDELNRMKRMTHGTIEDFKYTYTSDNLISSVSSLNSQTQLPTEKHASTANEMNQITQFGNASYQFNHKGQTTTKTDTNGTTLYHWDSRERLKSVTLPNGQTVSYNYDSLGRRISRTFNNQTTNFVYDAADVVQDKQGANQTDYLNGSGIDNKLRISSPQTGNLYFLTDHLGSTQGLTDTIGNITEWQRYSAFGESNVTNSLTRYGFTGREKDNDTNLIYYRARWYDPAQGRFISQDPIGFGGGNTNLYSYVSNNPISKTDPMGLYEIDVHYYLTSYLARKSGCFTDAQSDAIAQGDQGTDEPNEDDTLPGKGRVAQNSVFHALDKDAAEGIGSQTLWDNSTKPTPHLGYFGRYLHYLQDTFSHSGFTNSYWGHSPVSALLGGKFGTHATDKTKTDLSKTMRMAHSTWRAMKQWASQNCNCKGNDWDNSWDDQIRRFANIQTERPGLADIEGDTGVIGKWDMFASPKALRRKIEILGVPWR